MVIIATDYGFLNFVSPQKNRLHRCCEVDILNIERSRFLNFGTASFIHLIIKTAVRS
jgi:hypothetical protein